MAQKIRFMLFTDFKINLQKTPIYLETLREGSTFVSLSQKNGFEFVEQILHFKAFQQHSISKKFRFRLLADSRTSLQETLTWRESLRKVSKPISLSRKHGFVCVDQIWNYNNLKQYSMTQKIQFTLSTDFKINLQKTLIY